MARANPALAGPTLLFECVADRANTEFAEAAQSSSQTNPFDPV